jgi:hypothetical protein
VAGVIVADPPRVIEHIKVHYENGRFGGWPANHGVWSWGNEILVGFELGYFKDNATGHDIDYARPAEHVLGRSLDGGKTWSLERPEGLRPPPGTRVAEVPTSLVGKAPTDCPGGIDFTHPDFAMTFRMTSIHDGESRFHYSMRASSRTSANPVRRLARTTSSTANTTCSPS